MKKNTMMRLASFLLIAVLISTSAISGTYAKYVTQDSASDSARVAKWGVTVTANGETFATEYKADDTATLTAENAVSVKSDESGSIKDLVAPGTGADMVKVALTGTPEVAVKVTYDATVEINDLWKVNNVVYFPLVITVNGINYHVGVGEDTETDIYVATTAALKTKLEEVIDSYSKVYGPNQNLATVNGDYLAVSWSWPFYVSDNNDVKDTALGDAAANGNAGTFKISVKTTVTQID